MLNSAIGPADLLSGDFDLGGIGNRFALSGFGSFANLVAGSSFDGLGVAFDNDAAGTFVATLVLHATGSNASGFYGRLDDTVLVLRGDVARGHCHSGARDLPADGRWPGRDRGRRPAAWATSRASAGHRHEVNYRSSRCSLCRNSNAAAHASEAYTTIAPSAFIAIAQPRAWPSWS